MEQPSNLSAEQAAIVWSEPTGRHLLVLARPGSGKTHTLAARARRLIADGVDPEAILAMTFSNRAADELKDRLPDGRVWAGTFHAISADILEEFGAAIGVRWPFRIVDETRSRELLMRAAMESGVPLPEQGPWRNRWLNEVARRVEVRKQRGLAEHARDDSELVAATTVARIDDGYKRLLRETNSLDFTDLIVRTLELLASDDNTAAALQSRLMYLLIDEFHDISPEQYALISLLAPPRAKCQVFAVGDPDQSIYGWRNADAEMILRRFRDEYRPVEHHLTVNFRSRAPIVAAADALLGRQDGNNPARHGTVRPFWCECADTLAEARAVVDTINSALSSNRFAGYSAFAILYRTHAVGDLIEAELLQNEVPVYRVQNDRFFNDPDAQDSLRYLELALGLHDSSFEPALNWPRVIVDEVTMIRLRQLAASRNVPLLDIIRDCEEYREELSPLTCGVLKEFMATVGSDLAPIVQSPMTQAVEPFLDVLQSRRSPIQRADRESLRDTLDLLDPALRLHVAAMKAAMLEKRTLSIRPQSDPDAMAAAVIVEHALDWYFGIAIEDLQCPGTFEIRLGTEALPELAGLGIGPWHSRTVSIGVAVRAWRLMQALLMEFEERRDGPFLLLDVETGGSHPERAELLEVGIMPFESVDQQDQCFCSLVRPSGPHAISPVATDMHGLRWVDVADAPLPEEILPIVLKRLQGRTVVGHNIEEFDLPVLRHSATAVGLESVPMWAIDTYKMAKRLWPEEISHRLEDLARRTEPRATQTHRAHADCELTARLFSELLQASRRDREIDILTECLPVVAASIVTSELPIANDTELLANIGSRAHSLGHGRRLFAEWEKRVCPEAGALARSSLAAAVRVAPEEDERWRRLEQGWRTVTDMFARGQRDISVSKFLRHAALAQPVDSLHAGPAGSAYQDPRDLPANQRVTLMTVHSAKGLEWPVVFLVGVEDDLFPAHWAKTADEIAEERRCLYVGMTRAEDRLFLFSTLQRNGYRKRCSRFVAPLVGESIERLGSRN